MDVLDAIVLALIQVFTEFLPVSSSGHLVIAKQLLGTQNPGMSFTVLVHFGTLIAIIVYFLPQILTLLNTAQKEMEAEVYGPSSQLIVTVMLANVPAIIAGFVLRKEVEHLFTDATTASLMFLVTAFVLFLTRFTEADDGYDLYRIPLAYGMIIGVAQALAIMPGISRSGMTISFALFLLIQHEDAATFSFLLSIPAITGAALLKLNHLNQLETLVSTPYLMGFFVSCIGGLIALSLLMYAVRNKHFHLFSYYLLAAGLGGIVFFSQGIW